MASKKSAYGQLSTMPDDKTARFRDVYESQQLERSEIEPVSSKRSRIIIAAIAAGVLFLAVWFVLGLVLYALKVAYGNLMDEPYTRSLGHTILWAGWFQPLISLLVGAIAYGALHVVLMRNWHTENLKRNVVDINQYTDDQYIQPPDMVVRRYSIFPNLGAHSAEQPNSMISHIMCSNKGLKTIDMGVRAEKDDDEYLKGELMYDDNGEVITKKVPLMDEELGTKLFEASGMTVKKFQKKYNLSEIPYNPDNADRDRLSGYNTCADLANEEWDFPLYEPQRPCGVYLIDNAPVNTMILAITRAGKGQTYIEPVIDMWLREKNKNNMVVNDPKGELLVKHYVRATYRGYQVVQFNLINAVKTDIYNPLGLAADASREGDTTKAAQYVENIAEVFFPVEGSDDPVWPNAASNAFKRTAYGVIDYYLEEERELRQYAMSTGMSPEVLETRLDEMWGKVTLYNCYQLFVQLTAKKVPRPSKQLAQNFKDYAGRELSPDLKREYGCDSLPSDQEELNALFEELRPDAQKRDVLWGTEDEIDMLTLFFNASGQLPRNSMRTLVANADNALRSMGAAEKMLGSVYGIAITAMNFFVDPTISMLTSGTPSQNTDLAGLSFPRRIGVRFDANYLERESFMTMQAKWEAFSDPDFTNSLGKDFTHEDIVSREGWARYYFKGIFPENVAYLRLDIKHPMTGMLMKSFFFKFTKTKQMSLDGTTYMKDPVLGETIIKNGLLEEMIPIGGGHEAQHSHALVSTRDTDATFTASEDLKNRLGQLNARFDEAVEAGSIVSEKYTFGSVTFMQTRLTKLMESTPEIIEVPSNAIIQTMVRYSEKPKAVFLVTPPHLTKYAKLILILIKQLVDLNFEQSYMTKSNQKPLYKTRFMLDELGNLQSDGHGISSFETLLSIGLGQEQQFTLILQTLQQLKAVYGDDVDKIVQGNAQPLTAKIATTFGWVSMDDLVVGDQVCVPSGEVAPVSGIYPQGVRKVYRVETEDGASTEACDQHLWDVDVTLPDGVTIEDILGS